MASVTLTRSWLNLADDLTQSLAFYTADRSDSRTAAIDVRVYANGRVRAVTTPARTRTVGLTAVALTAAQVDLLDSWQGRTVLFRDTRGRRIFGVFGGFEVTDAPDRSGHDVALSVQRVTYVEGV